MTRIELKEVICRIIDKMQGEAPKAACLFGDVPDCDVVMKYGIQEPGCDATTKYAIGEEG